MCFSGAYSQETILLRTEFQDVLPKFVISDGVSSGISFEIMKLIERKSRYRFVHKESLVPLARVVAGLESGYMDIQIGLQKTPEREAKLVFGPELYSVRLVAVVPKDSLIGNTVSIRDLIASRSTVLTPFGTGASSILRAIPGLLVDDQARTAEANMEKMLSMRGSILIYHDLSLAYLMAKSRYAGLLRVVDIDSSGYAGFEPLGQFIVYSRSLS
ncbi:MAG: transporter substrate-binding domain-containing protein, partial [Spirochaetales bacterium]|nr:transporter substrate-binding domain-containing protein [Spirochaetales bacterium]